MRRALLLLIMLSAGCVTVKPWQRETLAAPAMIDPPWPMLHRLEQHVFAVREASSGATGAAGGGCGCN
jgi:hypothetical protein